MLRQTAKKCRKYSNVTVNHRAVRFLELLGAGFKRQYDMDSYQRFFEDAGYKNVDYYIVDGRMPCAVAVITKAVCVER